MILLACRTATAFFHHSRAPDDRTPETAAPDGWTVNAPAGRCRRRDLPCQRNPSEIVSETAGKMRLASMNIMQDQDMAELRVRLARLEIEHEDFDHAINAMVSIGTDQLRVQRFKKKKLALKDEITKLRARIIPDIIA